LDVTGVRCVVSEAKKSASSSSSSSSASPLHLDAQLCFAITSASRAMAAAYAPVLEPLGLTHPQYLVMLVLWEQDGIRVTELGRRLHLDSGTLTPLLKRLAARGIVERRRATDDERAVEIHLTPAGRALRDAAENIPSTMACSMAIDVDELSDLRERLHALAARLRG
jgi:DNA-binding MarR family transcriptional regulator